MEEPCIGISIFAITIGIIINAYLVLIETSITESSRTRLEKLADNGNENAKKALDIMEEPMQLLAVVQSGITFISILLGTISGTFIAPYISLIFNIPFITEFSILVSVLAITYLNLLLGEFLPRKISMENPEYYLVKYVKGLLLLELFTRPAIYFLNMVANRIMVLIGINPHFEDTVTEDEVKDLIEQGMEDGIFEKTEQTMVDRIFHMSDQTAYSLMTPRTQMLWLDLEDTLEYNLQQITSNPDNVFPIGRGSLDDFCGVLYAKDLLNAAISSEALELEKFIKKPLLIPRSMETFRVLEKFQEELVREAVVLDEYGGVIGFITLDDITRAIIGDTTPDQEDESSQIISQDENSWIIEGLCSIDDFKQKFNIELLPNEIIDKYQTMGGFIISFLGYIPKTNDILYWDHFTFEILAMDRARIDKVLVRLKI